MAVLTKQIFKVQFDCAEIAIIVQACSNQPLKKKNEKWYFSNFSVQSPPILDLSSTSRGRLPSKGPCPVEWSLPAQRRVQRWSERDQQIQKIQKYPNSSTKQDEPRQFIYPHVHPCSIVMLHCRCFVFVCLVILFSWMLHGGRGGFESVNLLVIFPSNLQCYAQYMVRSTYWLLYTLDDFNPTPTHTSFTLLPFRHLLFVWKNMRTLIICQKKISHASFI